MSATDKRNRLLALGEAADGQLASYIHEWGNPADLAMGQVIAAWVMTAVRHPEWAVGIVTPFLDERGAEATVDRVIRAVPVSQYDGDSV